MIEMSPFKMNEADKFLKNALPQLPDESIKKIIDEYTSNEKLLPCKLSMVAGVLNQEFEKTVEDILSECRFDGYVVKIISQLESKDCIKLLNVATLIDPDYISFEFVKQIKWEESIKEAIQKLSNFNLLTRVYSNTPKYGIKMHRMFIKDFKEYFESKENCGLNKEIKNEIIQIINRSLDYDTYIPSTHLKTTNNSVILHAIEILKQKDTSDSLIESQLYETVGQYFEHEIHQYETALVYSIKALEIKMKLINGVDSPLADSLVRTANAYKKIGSDEQS